MVTPVESYVIDPEFAFYGPIAFDVAKILAELLLAFFATDGLEAQDGAGASRQAQRGEHGMPTVCLFFFWGGGGRGGRG